MFARVRTWVLSSAVLLAMPSFALASVTVSAPSDWRGLGELDAGAGERANTWATALSAVALEIHCSAGGDDYTETMALLERAEAIPAKLIDDVDASLAWLDAQTTGITGGTPAEEGQWIHGPEIPGGVFRARYLVGDERIQISVIPDGESTVFLVMSHRKGDELLYNALFDEVNVSLAGGAAPVNPYDVDGFRKFNFIAWLLGLGLAYGISLVSFSERKGDHARVGRFAAIGLAGLAAVAALAIYVMMGDQGDALAAVGSSPSSLATEVFGVGVLAAGLAFVLGVVLQRDEGIVRSAPDATLSLSRRIEAAEAEREHAEDEPTRIGPAPTPPPSSKGRKGPPRPPSSR